MNAMQKNECNFYVCEYKTENSAPSHGHVYENPSVHYPCVATSCWQTSILGNIVTDCAGDCSNKRLKFQPDICVLEKSLSYMTENAKFWEFCGQQGWIRGSCKCVKVKVPHTESLQVTFVYHETPTHYAVVLYSWQFISMNKISVIASHDINQQTMMNHIRDSVRYILAAITHKVTMIYACILFLLVSSLLLLFMYEFILNLRKQRPQHILLSVISTCSLALSVKLGSHLH